MKNKFFTRRFVLRTKSPDFEGSMGIRMGTEQMKREIMYKTVVMMLKNMLERGMITKEEHHKITLLNIDTFSPELKKVYV